MIFNIADRYIGTRMKKGETLKTLENAQRELTRFVESTKLLIDGIDTQERILPIVSRKTKFGEWFYTDGQKLKALSNNPLECMSNIENLHENLHKTYKEIFDIYYLNEKKGSLLSKILKPKQKILSESEYAYVNKKYSMMEKTVQDLLDEISRLKRRLTAVSEEKINSLL